MSGGLLFVKRISIIEVSLFDSFSAPLGTVFLFLCSLRGTLVTKPARHRYAQSLVGAAIFSLIIKHLYIYRFDFLNFTFMTLR